MTISRQYKKFVKATGAVGMAFLLSPTFTGVINGREAVEAGKLQRGVVMANALVLSAPHDKSVSFKHMDPRFVGEVLNSAEWAAGELNIPAAFVKSHWFMESGKLEMVKGFTYIEKNNFGGFRFKGKPMEFADPHSFADAYVKLLRKDGVHDIDDFDDIVKRLYDKHYVTGESSYGYKMKIRHTMDLLGAADPSIRLYAEQIDRKHQAVDRNKAHAPLGTHLRNKK